MNPLFITPQSKLSSESWRLMLKQKSDQEKYMEKQKKILREVFG